MGNMRVRSENRCSTCIFFFLTSSPLWTKISKDKSTNIPQKSGYSPVGRAGALGASGRAFESRYSDQKCRNGLMPFLHFSFEGETRTIQCNCPADSCLPPARRRQLFCLPSLATRTISQNAPSMLMTVNSLILVIISFLT